MPIKNFELLTRKGQFPYEYVTGPKILEQKTLPEKSKFFSKLKNSGITDSEYNFAKEVFSTFNCKTLGDYHDLYCASDTMLLSDCFESFRRLCKKTYNLEPCHFATSPGLTWQAALKYTGVELELLSDVSMNLFIDNAMKGGFSGVITPLSIANNPGLKNWDPKQSMRWISLFDCNNQYGRAMSEPLPFGEFKWVSQYDLPLFTEQYIRNELDHYGNIAYFIECDLIYPTSLHDYHNEFPYAMENFEIKKELLSPYQQKLATSLNLSVGGSKLCTTLYNKYKYITHSRNLKQILDAGLKIKKVHRVLQFSQSMWQKSYVDLNTNIRRTSDCPVLKNFAKLMVNSCFGKFCEDVRRHRDVKLIFDEKRLQFYVRKPTFNRAVPYDENFCVIELKKNQITLNKPRYIGAAILCLSKLYMYNFHYNFIKKYWPGSSSKLLFTDTDSLCYQIKFEGDFYRKLKNINIKENIIDFSNFDPKKSIFNAEHRLQPGFFKDEMGGKIISMFVGLRSKMYSIEMADGFCKKTGKGITHACKEKLDHHKDYLNILNKKTFNYVKMGRIISKKHKLYSVQATKIGLSCLNDKRFFLENGKSYSFGHYSLLRD